MIKITNDNYDFLRMIMNGFGVKHHRNPLLDEAVWNYCYRMKGMEPTVAEDEVMMALMSIRDVIIKYHPSCSEEGRLAGTVGESEFFLYEIYRYFVCHLKTFTSLPPPRLHPEKEIDDELAKVRRSMMKCCQLLHKGKLKYGYVIADKAVDAAFDEYMRSNLAEGAVLPKVVIQEEIRLPSNMNLWTPKLKIEPITKPKTPTRGGGSDKNDNRKRKTPTSGTRVSPRRKSPRSGSSSDEGESGTQG
jgi:hypothetical protein